MKFAILVTSALFLFPTFAISASGEWETPNIIIILADDLGYGDAGCYNEQSKIPTPNIDRLATQGLRFTDAHTPSSVCTPTRYGLLTGRFCWRTKLKSSVLWPWDPPLIEQDRLTLPAMLQQHGYRTACIGKWHLGWDWPLSNGKQISDEFSGVSIPPTNRQRFGERVDFSRSIEAGPITRGFDYYFGDDVPNFPPYCFIENDFTIGIPSSTKPAEMFGHDGPALPAWDLSLVMPTITQKAVQFIEQHSKSPGKPFFLFTSLTAPHTPIAPSPHFIGKSGAGWYGDLVCEVDWTVGQIMEALDRTGLAENTLVIFTSDNGSPQRDGKNMSGEVGSVLQFGHDPSRPWRGMKGDAWEGGHRVPFIARWPNQVPANKTCDEPIILTDLMRTIAEFVGHDLPANTAEDSYDFGPVLLGKDYKTPIHPFLIHHSASGLFAIRRDNWKLILGKLSGGFTRFRPSDDAPAGQLYDLFEDPEEQTNLYAEHPDVVARLTSDLDKAKRLGYTFEADIKR